MLDFKQMIMFKKHKKYLKTKKEESERNVFKFLNDLRNVFK